MRPHDVSEFLMENGSDVDDEAGENSPRRYDKPKE
jgi:hypothetical protein